MGVYHTENPLNAHYVLREDPTAPEQPLLGGTHARKEIGISSEELPSHLTNSQRDILLTIAQSPDAVTKTSLQDGLTERGRSMTEGTIAVTLTHTRQALEGSHFSIVNVAKRPPEYVLFISTETTPQNTSRPSKDISSKRRRKEKPIYQGDPVDGVPLGTELRREYTDRKGKVHGQRGILTGSQIKDGINYAVVKIGKDEVLIPAEGFRKRFPPAEES